MRSMHAKMSRMHNNIASYPWRRRNGILYCEVACQKCRTWATGSVNEPEIGAQRCYSYPETAALLPPFGDITQPRYPHRERLLARAGEQHCQCMLAEHSALRMEIQCVKPTRSVDTLHNRAPYSSNLLFLCHA